MDTEKTGTSQAAQVKPKLTEYEEISVENLLPGDTVIVQGYAFVVRQVHFPSRDYPDGYHTGDLGETYRTQVGYDCDALTTSYDGRPLAPVGYRHDVGFGLKKGLKVPVVKSWGNEKKI